LDRIEVLGFIDKGVSMNWIQDSGCKVINLLCKGSLKHVTEQLHKTPDQHLQDIKYEIALAQTWGISVNLYLEDWSNGIQNSPDYVSFLMENLKSQPVKRFMLPDTLGVLNPDQTREFCESMVQKYPELHFDFHAHNDYDLAVANVCAAVRAGVRGVHTTVNGLGERAGNAPLASVIAVLHDHLKIKTNLREEKLISISKIVESYSGIRIPANKPVIGENVFTQCAGVHADGDIKNNLYCNDLLPERFGRTREYALGKNSGKASIHKNLDALGIELDEESLRLVTERIIQLGDKKELVTQEDLPYIISDVLKQVSGSQPVHIKNYSLSLAQGLKPVATVMLDINGETYQETSPGDGQYDAFMKALYKIYKLQNRPFPLLTNYSVTIPPGGRTDALVQTVISWVYKSRSFKTSGLDADQIEAAIKATLKMLNIIEDKDMNK
jgi:D-citramalate synthase